MIVLIVVRRNIAIFAPLAPALLRKDSISQVQKQISKDYSVLNNKSIFKNYATS